MVGLNASALDTRPAVARKASLHSPILIVCAGRGRLVVPGRAVDRRSPVAREPVATDDAVGPTRPFSPRLLTLRRTWFCTV